MAEEIKTHQHTVRYFLYDDEESDIVEVDEREWLESDYPIEYERHTIRENGTAQICLTKIPTF